MTDDEHAMRKTDEFIYSLIINSHRTCFEQVLPHQTIPLRTVGNTGEKKWEGRWNTQTTCSLFSAGKPGRSRPLRNAPCEGLGQAEEPQNLGC